MWLYKQYPYCGVPKNSREAKRLAQYQNDFVWQNLFNRTVSIAVNQFEWVGMPETCDTYFFEKLLLFNTKACVIFDPDFNAYLSLPCTEASPTNLYYESGFYKAFSRGYEKRFMALTHYNKDLFDKMLLESTEISSTIKGVVCEDNQIGFSMLDTIILYVDRIMDAMRTIDVVAKQLKLAALIETDEDSKLAVKTAIDYIDSNVLAVFASGKVTKAVKESKSIPTGVNPSTIEAAWNHLHNLQSELLTAFGTNNLNTGDKRERLITSEVESNNDYIQLNAAYRLDSRLHFCENFNSVFGTNISCKIRHDFTENVGKQNNKVGGEDDERITDTE